MDKAPDAYRTISEVGEDLDIAQHVLRFWETRFPQIKPLKRGGGRRYYRPDDVELLKGIRHLLYKEGYTIKGVQRILKEQGVRAVQAFAEPLQMQAWQAEIGSIPSIPFPPAPPISERLPGAAIFHRSYPPMSHSPVRETLAPTVKLPDQPGEQPGEQPWTEPSIPALFAKEDGSNSDYVPFDPKNVPEGTEATKSNDLAMSQADLAHQMTRSENAIHQPAASAEQSVEPAYHGGKSREEVLPGREALAAALSELEECRKILGIALARRPA